MDKKKFEEIDNYLNADDKNLARKELITISQTYQHDPDYLYLRARLLKFDQNIYMAIDALIISLQIHQSEKSFNLLSELFSIIGNQEFSDKLKNKDLQSDVLKKLVELMPGIIWKKKIKNLFVDYGLQNRLYIKDII